MLLMLLPFIIIVVRFIRWKQGKPLDRQHLIFCTLLQKQDSQYHIYPVNLLLLQTENDK